MNFQGDMQPNNTADGRPGAPSEPPAAAGHSHAVEVIHCWPDEPAGITACNVMTHMVGDGRILLQPKYLYVPFRPKFARLYRSTAMGAAATMQFGLYDADGMAVLLPGSFDLNGTGVVEVTFTQRELRSGQYYLAYHYGGQVSGAVVDGWPAITRSHINFRAVFHPAGANQTILPDFLDVQSTAGGNGFITNVVLPFISMGAWP